MRERRRQLTRQWIAENLAKRQARYSKVRSQVRKKARKLLKAQDGQPKKLRRRKPVKRKRPYVSKVTKFGARIRKPQELKQ